MVYVKLSTIMKTDADITAEGMTHAMAKKNLSAANDLKSLPSPHTTNIPAIPRRTGSSGGISKDEILSQAEAAEKKEGFVTKKIHSIRT